MARGAQHEAALGPRTCRRARGLPEWDKGSDRAPRGLASTGRSG